MSAAPRPRIVTLACVFVGFSAFLLLLDLIQALTSWGTIEMQDALRPSLTALNDRGLDVTMGELLGTLRWIGLACVLLLVAAAVFAAYAARGDQLSRIGTTVLAVFTGFLILPFGWFGVLQAMLLLGAAYALWSPDARRWYAARRAPEGAPLAPGLGGPAPPAIDSPVEDADVQANPNPHPWAAAPAPTESTVVATVPPSPSTHRPRAVLAAGLVTVIGSGLVGGLSGLYLVVYGFARDEYVKVVQDGPFADLFSAGELQDALRAAFWACLAMLPLAAAGLAAGLSLLARLRVGRLATLVLAWITAAAGIVLVPFGLLGTGAAVAVIVLLNRDESRAWTASAR